MRRGASARSADETGQARSAAAASPPAVAVARLPRGGCETRVGGGAVKEWPGKVR